MVCPTAGCVAVVAFSLLSAFPAAAQSTAKVLTQMERDWVRAKDYKTLDRILADDWLSTDFQGKTTTKSQALAALKANSSQPAIELGEMKVRVFGTTAVVTGKDTTGRYAWMDVFVKRNGRWQAVASQSTRTEK
jgi:hypothetical protein